MVLLAVLSGAVEVAQEPSAVLLPGAAEGVLVPAARIQGHAGLMPIDPNRLCKCHGEPMFWERDSRKPSGRCYRCHVARCASRLKAVKRWQQTPHGKATARRYDTSEKGRARSRRHEAKSVKVDGNRVRLFKSPAVAQAVRKNLHVIKQAVLDADPSNG